MKVALLCSRFYPHKGGVETVVMELASNLAALGNTVTVLTQTESKNLPKNEQLHNFTILRFMSIGLGNDITAAPTLLSYLMSNANDFDVVHAHNYHAFPAFAAACTKKTVFIFSPHYHGTGHTFLTHLLHYPYRVAGDYIFSKSNAIVCDTSEEAILIKKHFPHYQNKIYVVPLGVNIDSILSSKPTKEKKPFILSAGRLDNYKNVDVLIKAIPYVDRALSLVIVGQGPELQRLKQLCSESQLRGRVSFLGRVSDDELYGLLRSAMLYVTLSDKEAYGLTFLEAAVAGVGVVASSIPSHRELVQRFKIKNVQMIPPKSLPSVVAKRIEMGQRKRVRVGIMPPTWKQVTREMLDVYNKHNK